MLPSPLYAIATPKDALATTVWSISEERDVGILFSQDPLLIGKGRR